MLNLVGLGFIAIGEAVEPVLKKFDSLAKTMTGFGYADLVGSDAHKKGPLGGAEDVKGLFRQLRDEDGGKKKNSTVSGGGGTNIQKVEIVVTSNQDPERIARLTVEKLKDLSRYPTSSRFAPNPMGR
jgi:hypothetical protein